MASSTQSTAAESRHGFQNVEEGADIRLAVSLPAQGDEFHLDGAKVEDFLFLHVEAVERFDAGDVREIVATNRERGRLRVRWCGRITEVDEDAESHYDELAVAHHRGETLRVDEPDE